jgi:hypothetical protein
LTRNENGCCTSQIAYSALYIGALLWFHFIQDQQGLSSKTYAKFINPIAGLFGLITTFWAAIVYLRKASYFRRRHQSKHVVPARLLAICTVCMLIISGLFIYPGAHNLWVMLVYTYGMWMLIQAEVLIFIFYSAFPIRFRPKLVGFVFASRYGHFIGWCHDPRSFYDQCGSSR